MIKNLEEIMNKKEIVAEIAEKTGLAQKDAHARISQRLITKPANPARST